MSLGNFCEACQAIPVHGYCGLGGCPTRPGADTPMDFESCFERLVMWAMAYAAELEEDGATGIIGQINRDQLFMRSELDWVLVMSEGLPDRGVYVPRPDLAIGAIQVAVNADQLDVATCFAKTAIDFLTGNYDPENFDMTDEERAAWQDVREGMNR